MICQSSREVLPWLLLLLLVLLLLLPPVVMVVVLPPVVVVVGEVALLGKYASIDV
jgi:hypothetical protein